MRYLVLACALATSVVDSSLRVVSSGDDDRFNVTVNVLPDGSVEVLERSDLTLERSRFFRRTAPVRHHDGVSGVSGSMDGVEFPLGTGPGQLEVGRGPGLDVTWHFPAEVSGRHLFILNYKAAGAIETSGIRGTLSWRVLEGQHGYEPVQTCVAVTIPESAVILDNPGFEEFLATPAAVRPGQDAMCSVVSNGETLTRRVTFTIDTMTVAEPSWQYYQRRSRDLIPAFISGGLFLLVIGAGVVAMVRMKYSRSRVRPTREEAPEVAPDLERAIVTEKYDGEVLPRLIAAGLLDSERMQVARDLRRAAIATLLLGAASWAFTSMALGHLGPWPLAIPIGILVSGLMFAIAGRRFSILSDKGMDAQERMLYSARARNGRTSA